MISFLSKLRKYIHKASGTYVHRYSSARTHTHLYLYLYLPLPELATWLPLKGVSQQEVTTGGLVGSGDTSLISTAAWPPQCIGVLIYGLARPMI